MKQDEWKMQAASARPVGSAPAAAMENDADKEQPPRLSLRDLFVVFVKAGLAFGGGLGILAVLEDELVKRRQAVSAEEFLAIYGIGRIIPSGTMTALAVAYGYRFGGFAGTVVALTSLVLPAFLITLALTVGYEFIRRGPVLDILPVTILPAALALIVAAAYRLGRPFFRLSWELPLAAAAFGAATLLDVNATVLLIAGGLLGIVLSRWRGGERA